MKRLERSVQGDLEDRAASELAIRTVSPAGLRRPIEVPIGSLDQSTARTRSVRTVEGVERRQDPVRRDSENRSPAVVEPALRRGSVEIPIRGLDQPRIRSVA